MGDVEFSDLVPYRISQRAVKYPRLELKTGELLVILPHGTQANALVGKYKNWIMQKFDFINECMEKTHNKKLITRTEEEFRELIHTLARETSIKLRVKLHHIYFRKMKTKWASLSSAKNLTVNRLMKHLPECLMRYVIFHELAHIIERRHNKTFWKIISGRYTNYREMENELFTYWFIISKNSADRPTIFQRPKS